MSASSLVNQIKSIYTREFNTTNFLLINAPGRINLIGEHTDYNHGLVLPGAIDKSIVFGMGLNQSSLINILSLQNEQTSISLDFPEYSISPNWGKYFQAMLEEIKDRNIPLEGVNACFGGDIPIGSGISSSAALCCGFLFGLNKLFDWDLSLLELAQIAQASEHRIGANVGLMDQFVVLHGEKNRVISLDCLDYSYHSFPLNLNDHSLILINSNVKHELVDSAYNERRKSCEYILTRLQVDNPQIKTLRDISLDDLKILKNDHLQDVGRVAFVLQENERVRQTTQALSNQDLGRVGELLYESHQGLSKEYQVSCPELDLLVDLASNEKGVLGARMMGGGFGGCTINLIASEEVELVVSRIMKEYFDQTQIKPEYYEVSLENGVHLLEP